MIELVKVPYHCLECDDYFYPEEYSTRDGALRAYTEHRAVCGR